MRKLLILALLIPSLSQASFPEFEPSMTCLAGAAGGYLMSSSGDELVGAAVACGVGYYVGTVMNDHYKEKYTKDLQKQVEDLKQQMEAVQMVQARKSMQQIDGGYYRIKERVVKGQKLPNGAVRAPTLETYIDEATNVNDVRVGK